MKNYLGLSYIRSLTSIGVATCCVMPMTLMLFGAGGSWLAVFGKIAAASYYVLIVSTVILALAWIVARRRESIARLKWWLTGSTLLTALAWLVAINEARINEYLITLM